MQYTRNSKIDRGATIMSEDEMKNDKGEEKCIGDGPLAQLFQSFFCKITMHQNMYNNGGFIKLKIENFHVK